MLYNVFGVSDSSGKVLSCDVYAMSDSCCSHTMFKPRMHLIQADTFCQSIFMSDLCLCPVQVFPSSLLVLECSQEVSINEVEKVLVQLSLYASTCDARGNGCVSVTVISAQHTPVL